MARDAAEYKRIGRWVASRKSGKGIHEIYSELVSLLRCPPTGGNLRNAVQHMWRYVSPYASFAAEKVEEMSSWELISGIQHLTFQHDVIYLKESTALGEFPAWNI